MPRYAAAICSCRCKVLVCEFVTDLQPGTCAHLSMGSSSANGMLVCRLDQLGTQPYSLVIAAGFSLAGPFSIAPSTHVTWPFHVRSAPRAIAALVSDCPCTSAIRHRDKQTSARPRIVPRQLCCAMVASLPLLNYVGAVQRIGCGQLMALADATTQTQERNAGLASSATMVLRWTYVLS